MHNAVGEAQEQPGAVHQRLEAISDAAVQGAVPGRGAVLEADRDEQEQA